jgi:hypothetical protein
MIFSVIFFGIFIGYSLIKNDKRNLPEIIENIVDD